MLSRHVVHARYLRLWRMDAANERGGSVLALAKHIILNSYSSYMRTFLTKLAVMLTPRNKLRQILLLDVGLTVRWLVFGWCSGWCQQPGI